jgi:polyhydroxybutyrate depolymerase
MIKWILTGLVLWAWPVWADSLTVALDERSYVIKLPSQAARAPIILALHGGGGNPDQFARNSGLSKPALAQGYAVIYPAGSARGRLKLLSWNGGYCCAYAAKAGIDDVAFLDAVVADAAAQFGLDANRVYITGISNGSLMAERYAAERPDRVKAVAGVSGTLDVDRIPVTGPVPLLHIHGTADTNVPYAGGVGPNAKQATDWSSVDDVIAAFVQAEGSILAKTSRVIDPNDDNTRVVIDDYKTANGVVMVRLMKIEGGGHSWPGGRRSARQGGTTDIDGATEVLRFFALHP